MKGTLEAFCNGGGLTVTEGVFVKNHRDPLVAVRRRQGQVSGDAKKL